LPVLRPALFGAAVLLVERGVLEVTDLAGVTEAASDARPRFFRLEDGAAAGEFS